MIQVYFLKPPTGDPWKLGYSVGDFGWVRPQKAKAMEKAGVIAPVSIPEPDDGDFVTVAELEGNPPALDTIEKVEKRYGDDVTAMLAYCEKNEISASPRIKRPATLWKKIAEHYAKTNA